LRALVGQEVARHPQQIERCFHLDERAQHLGERGDRAILVDGHLGPRAAREVDGGGRVPRRIDRAPGQFLGGGARLAEVVLRCAAHPLQLEGLLHVPSILAGVWGRDNAEGIEGGG